MKSGTDYFDSMNALFDNKSFSGFKFDFNVHKSPQTEIKTTFNIKLPYININERDSHIKFVPTQNRIFNAQINHNLSDASKINVSIGQKNFISFQKYDKSMATSVRCRCDFTPTLVVPSIFLENKSLYHNLSIQTQTRDFLHMALLDAKITVGYKGLILTYQLFKDLLNSNDGHSAIIHYDAEKFQNQLAFVLNNSKSFLFRTKYNHNENISAGIQLHVDSELNSKLDVAWIAKINDSTVHSCIDTDYNVSTVFKHELYPNCNMLMSGHLNHTSAQYIFGLGIQWDD